MWHFSWHFFDSTPHLLPRVFLNYMSHVAIFWRFSGILLTPAYLRTFLPAFCLACFVCVCVFFGGGGLHDIWHITQHRLRHSIWIPVSVFSTF